MSGTNDNFSQKTCDQILKTYGKNPFGTALIEYNNKESEGVMAITKTDPIVCIGDECLSRKVEECLYPRLRTLAEFIESDIVWVTCHSNRCVIPKNVDERMHIFSMMTPAWVEFRRKKIDSYTINGETIILPPGQMDYAEPILDDIPNCDGIYDDYGHLMALMVGYNIYILNDCMHCSNPESLKIAITVFEHIINEAVRLWNECEGGEI